MPVQGEPKSGPTSAMATGVSPISSIRAIAVEEWRQLVHTPLTALFQIWFLLALAICIFIVADFYSTDRAALDLQWTFLPWIMLAMLPALAMRAFAEGAGDRSLELTLSLPVSVASIVIGKWLAGSAVLLMTLAMTVPFVFTVGYLGEPDWGAVATGYMGAALMLCACYAVTLLAAACSRDQIGSFVVGIGGLAILLLLGWDTTPRAIGGRLGDVVALLSTISPKHWMTQFSVGRIPVAGIAYFCLLAGLSLAGATMLINKRRRAGSFRQEWNLVWVAGCVIGLVVSATLLTLVARLPIALDMTIEKEFTPHDETLDIVRSAPSGTKVEFFYSANDTPIPARIRAHAWRTRNLLQQISENSDGRVQLSITLVEPDTDEEEAALAGGVRRIPLSSGDSFMLGATFRHGVRQSAITYFDDERDQLLEYDLALAIGSLGKKKIPRVGVLSPLLSPGNLASPREGLAILEEIKRQYDVAIVPHFAEALPAGLDALFVIDAPILKPQMLCAIDRHVTTGGGLVAITDPYPRFNRANVAISPEPGSQINDITDLLDRYGITYLGPNVVGDPALAAPVAGPDNSQINYPFWLRIRQSSLARNHSVTAGLNELLFAEAGALRVDTSTGRGTALIRTGAATGLQNRDAFKSGAPASLASALKPDGKGARTVAASRSGPFEPAMPNCETSGSERSSEARKPERPGQVFAVADADWLFDPMALQDVQLGERVATRPLNDNVTFLLNMLEFATGDPRLISIRSRGRLHRPFTKVAELLQKGQARYRSEAASTVARITKVEENISRVMRVTGAKNVDQLPKDLQNEIRELRRKLLPFRRALRETRRKMREDVEQLGRRLTLLNFVAGPLFVILLFLTMRWQRRRTVDYMRTRILSGS